MATLLGRKKLAGFLSEAGANLEASVGSEHITPLQVAVCRNQQRWYDPHWPILCVLLVRGVNILPEKPLQFDTWGK